MIGFIEITQRETLEKFVKGLSENQINDICEKLSNNYDVFLCCDDNLNVISVHSVKNINTCGQLYCGDSSDLETFKKELNATRFN